MTKGRNQTDTASSHYWKQPSQLSQAAISSVAESRLGMVIIDQLLVFLLLLPIPLLAVTLPRRLVADALLGIININMLRFLLQSIDFPLLLLQKQDPRKASLPIPLFAHSLPHQLAVTTMSSQDPVTLILFCMS
jgi:hypothetical protein